MRYDEHNLQAVCFRWLRLTHSDLNAFAVPNGAKRSVRAGAWYKEEGLKAGVADVIILKATSEYHGLCIEMKTRTGRQADTQKVFQSQCEREGYRYAVCRSLDDFIEIIENYLK